eukprot:scaffold143704_cov51-Prasinocladus_malaysianus.AAC.1
MACYAVAIISPVPSIARTRGTSPSTSSVLSSVIILAENARAALRTFRDFKSLIRKPSQSYAQPAPRSFPWPCSMLPK